MAEALGLTCISCGAEYPLTARFEGCLRCSNEKFLSSLTVSYDYEAVANTISTQFRDEHGKGIWKYRKLLPVHEEQYMLSLDEGKTPLLHCDRLGDALKLSNLYIKDESRNPTWSFKDRLCCVAVAKGLEFGAKVTVVSSSGNHGASTAAYSAKGGLRCIIFTLRETPSTFLTLMQAYGAIVIPVTTSEGRWTLMQRTVKEHGWYPTGSYTQPMPTGNPYGMEGCKTMAYEIGEQLAWTAPSRVLMPLGLGEGFFGVWKGFSELVQLDFIDTVPPMVAVEPAVAAPLKHALDHQLDYVTRVPTEPTVAISISGGISSSQALYAVRTSDGTAVTVTEAEILRAQLDLASLEGLYAEATSAATIAALRKMVEQGNVDPNEPIVCIMTSGGLKDPECTRNVLPPPQIIAPNWNQFARFMNRTHNMKL